MFIDIDTENIIFNTQPIQEYKMEKKNPTLSCVLDASKKYELPPSILLAILDKEGGKSGTMSKNKDGSIDHGSAQINTVWVKHLNKKYNIPMEGIRDNGCYNVLISAYILKDEIKRAKGDFWLGVGNYHINYKKYPKTHLNYRNDVAKKAFVYEKWLNDYFTKIEHYKNKNQIQANNKY